MNPMCVVSAFEFGRAAYNILVSQMKYCDSNHHARDDANAPAQRRWLVNGIGAVVCSRHYYFRKHGVGDLQRGERYV